MTDSLRIRSAIAADGDALLDIYAASKLDEMAFEPVVPALLPLQDDPARYAVFLDSRVFVAQAERLLGYVALRDCEITGLFVLPAARGRGVGGRLLRHALERVGQPARLSVAASNAPAIALYMRHGFAVCGEFLAEYNGVAVRALGMRRGVGLTAQARDAGAETTVRGGLGPLESSRTLPRDALGPADPGRLNSESGIPAWPLRSRNRGYPRLKAHSAGPRRGLRAGRRYSSDNRPRTRTVRTSCSDPWFASSTRWC